MTSVTTLSAEAFVAGLLATDDAGERSALIKRAALAPDSMHTAVLLLVNEAERLLAANLQRAEEVCVDARAVAEKAGDPFLQAMVQMRHADTLPYRGRNAEARIRYDEAAAVFARLGRPVEAARTRIGWVWATSRLGRPTEALAAARKARRVLLGHGETLRVAVLDLNAGTIHLENGHYVAALRHFTAALALSRSLGESGQRHAARSQMNRGLALLRLGRHREALAELRQARGQLQFLGQAANCAITDLNIGLIHLDLGNYKDALRAFDQAGVAFHTLGLCTEAVWAALHHAGCYLHLGRPADALAVLDSVEEDLRLNDNVPDALAIATRRVAALMMLGKQEMALSVLTEAEQRFPTSAPQHRAWLAVHHGALLLHENVPVEALAAARRAHDLARVAGMRRLVAEALTIQGSALLALGDWTELKRVADRASRLAHTVGTAPLLHRANELLGRVAEAESRTALAQRRYAEAIRELEREQQGVIFEFRESFAINRYTAYERLCSLQLGAGRQVEALATAERAKSRALADAIAGKVELRPHGNIAARRLAQELSRAREDYAAMARAGETGAGANPEAGPRLASQLASLEGRIADLRRRLQLAGADDLADMRLDAALPEMPADTSLIEFFFSGDEILRFQVDASGVRGAALSGTAPEIERLLRVFRLNLDTATRTDPAQRERLTVQARAILSRLYEQLFSGLEGLDAFQSLVIVPHGLLHYLPFHALHDGKRHLVERFAVSYAPSAALYGICRGRRPTRRGEALILAHSAGGRLPFTRDEADAVGHVLGASVHMEEDATRALLESAGRRASLIHIAAHGRFRPDAPLFSSIELADGPLTTADIFNLDLRATLVTLSACETGRSVVGGGDELAGLARAFLYAGAAGLLVSQWQVDDLSTAKLMAHVYDELRRGTGCAEALRTAQLRFLAPDMPQKHLQHPFYWAGFQLIGADHVLWRRPH